MPPRTTKQELNTNRRTCTPCGTVLDGPDEVFIFVCWDVVWYLDGVAKIRKLFELDQYLEHRWSQKEYTLWISCTRCSPLLFREPIRTGNFQLAKLALIPMPSCYTICRFDIEVDNLPKSRQSRIVSFCAIVLDTLLAVSSASSNRDPPILRPLSRDSEILTIRRPLRVTAYTTDRLGQYRSIVTSKCLTIPVAPYPLNHLPGSIPRKCDTLVAPDHHIHHSLSLHPHTTSYKSWQYASILLHLSVELGCWLRSPRWDFLVIVWLRHASVG